MTRRGLFRTLPAVVLALGFFPTSVLAHCDTMDGPVIKDARVALESRDPGRGLKWGKPETEKEARESRGPGRVLKWVKPEKEKEAREAFQHTLAVRALAPEARELADRYFF